MSTARDTTAPLSEPHVEMRRNVRQLASDVVTLAELHADLLQVELRQWLRGIVWPLVMAAIAILFGLAAATTLMLSGAYALYESTELGIALSLLIAGGVGVLTASVCGLAAMRLLRRDAQMLNRSATELRRNVQWLKEVIAHPTTASVN